MSCVEGLVWDVLVLARLSLSFDFCPALTFLSDRCQGAVGTPHGSVRAGQAARDHTTAPARLRAAVGAPRQPQALGTPLGTVQGWAGLWGAGCGITFWGLMAWGLTWGPGQDGGSHSEWAWWKVRYMSAPGALALPLLIKGFAEL